MGMKVRIGKDTSVRMVGRPALAMLETGGSERYVLDDSAIPAATGKRRLTLKQIERGTAGLRLRLLDQHPCCRIGKGPGERDRARRRQCHIEGRRSVETPAGLREQGVALSVLTKEQPFEFRPVNGCSIDKVEIACRRIPDAS